jgi:octaprenyl-diphosphate synthase
LRIQTENLVTTARTDRARTAAPTPAFSVTQELELVEGRLGELIRSREPRLTEISEYLIVSGGKRIRPAVTLLAYRASGGRDEELRDIVDVSVALELIHSASLLHDDIIDGSAFRRGRDSALRKFGLAETLVAGDFLFGRAYDLCARFEEKLIQWAVQACISLTEGEIMQGRFRRNPAVTLADYLEIVERKTASLFAAGARTAAYLARADGEVVEAVARAGHHVGMTFQMIDDVLDVIGVEAQTGKPLGIDLRDGSPSLPIVLTIGHDEEVRRIFQKPELTEDEVEFVIGRLRKSPALAEARRLADEHAALAQQALTTLPDSPHRDNLLWLVEQLVERVS